MVVVVVGAAVASYWCTTAAARATRPISVGAFVSRPPLHMCVCNEKRCGTHSWWQSATVNLWQLKAKKAAQWVLLDL